MQSTGYCQAQGGTANTVFCFLWAAPGLCLGLCLGLGLGLGLCLGQAYATRLIAEKLLIKGEDIAGLLIIAL